MSKTTQRVKHSSGRHELPLERAPPSHQELEFVGDWFPDIAGGSGLIILGGT